MKTLYLVVSLLLCIESIVTQAPGDGDPICLPGGLLDVVRFPIPENTKVLMDSRDYEFLLGNQGETVVWQQVDVDGIVAVGQNTIWTQFGDVGCRQRLFLCGFSVGQQNNWLITQHISRQTDILLPQVTAIVEYEFSSCNASSNCARTFSVWRYDTSTIDATSARDTNRYTQVANIAPVDTTGQDRQNETINMDFTGSETGFYLAIRDQDSCLFISRILVFYFVCPAVTENLVIHPEVLAPPISTTSQPINVNGGRCVENARPPEGDNPILTCTQGGVWSIIRGCTCDSGFSMNADGTSCRECPAGNYATVSSCLPCPANSNSTEPTTECSCLEGFYRNPSEGSGGDCALPPSAPLDIMVENRTDTAVFLTWEPPESAGGGNNLEYELSFQFPRADNRTIFGRVSDTKGQITGLCQFLNYTLFVSSETSVTEPIPEELFIERSITIFVTAPQPDLSLIANNGVVRVDNMVITWTIPDSSMPLLVTYRLTITGSSSGIVIHDAMTNGATFDASSLRLTTGTYTVQVVAIVNIDGCSGDLPVMLASIASLSVTQGGDGVSAPDRTNAIIIAVTVIGVIIIFLLIASAIIIIKQKNLRCAYHATDSKVIEEIPEYASTAIVQLRTATASGPPVPPPRICLETNTAYGVSNPAMEKNPAYELPLSVGVKSNPAYGQLQTQGTPLYCSDEYEN